MSADPLRVLGRLRRYEGDAARRDLAAGLRAVAEAEVGQRAVAVAVARELAVAADLGVDAVVAMAFAGWRQRSQILADTARAARYAAEEVVICGHAAVAAARAAAELVEVMRAEQVRAEQVAALRTEQAVLDEHGGRAVWLRRSAQ